MPNVSGRGHGDLHVIARVAVPKKLSKEQRQIIEELGRTMPGTHRRRRQRVGGQAVLRARQGHLRVSAGSSPALLIHFPAGTSAATRDRLVATLADHDLVAIQEDRDLRADLWTAHFGSDGARRAAAAALAGSAAADGLRIEPVDVEDDDWARRTQADLPAIRVGRLIVAPPWDMPSADVIGSATRHSRAHRHRNRAVAWLRYRPSPVHAPVPRPAAKPESRLADGHRRRYRLGRAGDRRGKAGRGVRLGD